MRVLTIIAAVLLMAYPIGSQEIQLDKLNSCSDMEAIVGLLNRSLSRPPRDCIAASSDAEERILQSAASIPRGTSTCFLRQSPSSALSGFSCVVISEAGKAASVDCFRQVSSLALDRYKRDYRARYAATTKKYLREGGRCASSSNGASEVKSTTMSLAIASIAQFDFAFGSELRLARGEGMVTHGFARMDEQLAGRDAAVEYLSAFMNSTKREPVEVEKQSSGEWTVRIDAMEDLLKTLNQSYRHVDAYVNGVSFEVESNGAQGRGDAEKLALRRSWMERIIWDLEERGFEYLPKRDYRKHGIDLGDWKKRMIESQPFGRRELAANRADDRVYVLIDKKSRCSRRAKDGALIGVLMGYGPTPGTVSSYGNVAVFVVGGGACRRGSGRDGIDNSIKHLAQTFPASLSRGDK